MSAKITIKNNGSIHVEGDFEIYDMEGGKYDVNGRTLVKLCRCGHSETKPFCDGAHKRIPFESTVKAYVLPPPKPKV